MRMGNTVVAAFLVVAGVGAAGGGWWVARSLDQAPHDSVGTDEVLSNLDLPVLGGGMDGPARRRGDVVLLDFWASWCSPCHVQSKLLAALAEEYTGSVRFYAVNVGESETLVQSSLEQHPISFPVLLDKNGETASRAGVVGMPTVVVLDRDGTIVLRRTGLTSARFLRATLDGLLEKADSANQSSGSEGALDQEGA